MAVVNEQDNHDRQRLDSPLVYVGAHNVYYVKLPTMVNNFISLHCLSRKELDTLIEHELQLMLAEGFDKSPISAKALHIRLKAKGIVKVV
ncbi:hypothetical protein NOH62_20875 [Escherichia coli]|nr:hypothetical protein [Escherichia sp. MOD1-EC5990]MCQ1944162.1 hypothetical protein [Escherichia coli]